MKLHRPSTPERTLERVIEKTDRSAGPTAQLRGTEGADVSGVESMGLIDPESPVRLRALITALAQHLGVQVLRVEVELGRSTRTDDGYALSMVVTHSLGPEHELLIGKPLAEAFSATLNALSRNASKPEEAGPTGGEERSR